MQHEPIATSISAARWHALRGAFVVYLLIHSLDPSWAAQNDEYRATVPPEILSQYDSAVIAGQRPRIVTVNQAMIWSLRAQPDQGGDLYRLDLDPRQLSSAQREVVSNWVASGAKVLIWGEYSCIHSDGIFDFLGSFITHGGDQGPVLSSHVVNTDVHDLTWNYPLHNNAFKRYPPETQVFASTSVGVTAGAAPHGAGMVIFACHDDSTWLRSGDRNRWVLNLYQWTLGLKVPGSASVDVERANNAGAHTSVIVDRISLRNGDSVTGRVLVETFEVETSYAHLSFKRGEIRTIDLEGDGNNVETISLRSGDKLSGHISPLAIDLELPGGQKTQINKEKIKRVEFAP